MALQVQEKGYLRRQQSNRIDLLNEPQGMYLFFYFQTSHFQLKLFPISKLSPISYLVQLYSLPPPSQEEMTQGLYERVIVNLPKVIGKSDFAVKTYVITKCTYAHISSHAHALSLTHTHFSMKLQTC